MIRFHKRNGLILSLLSWSIIELHRSSYSHVVLTTTPRRIGVKFIKLYLCGYYDIWVGVQFRNNLQTIHKNSQTRFSKSKEIHHLKFLYETQIFNITKAIKFTKSFTLCWLLLSYKFTCVNRWEHKLLHSGQSVYWPFFVAVNDGEDFKLVTGAVHINGRNDLTWAHHKELLKLKRLLKYSIN